MKVISEKNIKYLGKCVLIEEGKEKVLAVGDIHIGYGKQGEAYGAMVDESLYNEMIHDFEEIFSYTEKIDKIILLGDLKHSFSGLEKGEKYDLVNLFDYLEKKCKEIIVTKGNHDNYLLEVTSGRGIRVTENYIWKGYCFFHGDRDLLAIHAREVKCWLMGHMHPAVKLREETKMEKYKCFLSGEFEGRKVIILPCFADAGEGIDAREIEKEIAWNLDLGKFDVYVVGEGLEVLGFGKLNKIREK